MLQQICSLKEVILPLQMIIMKNLCLSMLTNLREVMEMRVSKTWTMLLKQ